MHVDQQWHGYKRGHQLLATTVELAARDQDLIDKLSDASGSPRPGETFAPYLTIYPLPSGRFHVVARTWQDLDATRSGTVFTRSLLIPSEDWSNGPSIHAFFDALASRDITTERAHILVGDRPWESIYNPNLAPLVEALFLERATAVAAFGFKQTDEICGRLLQSLWPARRLAMAVCTYALSPRSLPDRDFDLVFAPESARSRFTKWGGRKVVASNDVTLHRHEWTGQLQARIFIDPKPSLRELDQLGTLEGDNRSDSSALRLSLLWSDLRQQSRTSPTSLLGMLDILSSLNRRPWSVPELPNLIARSLSELGGSASTDEAWRYIQLLVRKLGDDIPLSILRSIFNATRRLVSSNPNSVLFGSDGVAVASLPHILRPSVARGLADLPPTTLHEVIRATEADLLVSLMKESPEFSETVASSLEAEPDEQVIRQIADMVEADHRAAKRIVGGVSRGAHWSVLAPLLGITIRSAPTGNFELLSRAVLAANHQPRKAIIDTLVEVAREIHQQHTLLKQAVTAPDTSEGDQIIVELVHDRESTAWLIDSLAENSPRRAQLLLQLMESWSDSHLREVLREGRNKDALFEASLSGLSNGGKAFVRLLRMVPAEGLSAAALLRRATPILTENERREASLQVLEQLLVLDPDRNADLLDPLLAAADPARIVSAAFSGGLPVEQVGRNLALIARSKSVERFVPLVDQITRRLTDRRRGGYGQAGYDGWARLLRLARQLHPEALIRSADAALDYAFARPNEPSGAVVAAAFPVIYARLRKNSLSDVPMNLITAILVLPLALLTDWDKSKTARHGIVDEFLRSKWDPVELLRAGVDAHIPGKILGYLVAQPGGRAYLRRIESGVRNYPQPARDVLIAALSDFRSDGS